MDAPKITLAEIVKNMGYTIRQENPSLVITGFFNGKKIMFFRYNNNCHVDSKGIYFSNLIGTRYYIGPNNKLVDYYDRELTLDD